MKRPQVLTFPLVTTQSIPTSIFFQSFDDRRTTSRSVASPSKLAGELLKSPTRTRTRTRGRDAASAAGRTRGAFNTSDDPFIDAVDVFDKENAPVPERSSRSRTVSTLEPQKGKGKAKGKAKAIQVVEKEASSPSSRPARRVLGDLNAQTSKAPQPVPASNAVSKKTEPKHAVPEDDSMAIDASSAVEGSVEADIPRASTPPLHASPPNTQTQDEPEIVEQAERLDAVSSFDTDENDSEDESDVEAATTAAKDMMSGTQSQIAEPTVTGTVVSQSSRSDGATVSFQPDLNDTVRSSDNTVSGTLVDPKLESARQAASALLTSKLQQQKDGNAEKPVKRTLASYGAKKSLPAAANNARPSNVTATLHPASTPAGPGFRSSFLNKSLRKQIADQEALESGDDSDSESDEEGTGLVAGATFAALYKKTAANTQANTRANAAPASSKKRKSDDALPVAGEAVSGSSAPPAKMSKLGAAMVAAKSQTSAPIPAAKKTPAGGPASKLEQFRNNLAHVARSTGSGASASSNSQTVVSVASTPAEEAAPFSFSAGKSPDAAVVPSNAATRSNPSSEDSKELQSRSSDSSSDSTYKIVPGTKSGESTIKASAIPRSPTRSAARADANSPLPLPPRTGSVRKSPRKLAEQLKLSQQDAARSASPGPKTKDSAAFSSRARTSVSPVGKHHVARLHSLAVLLHYLVVPSNTPSFPPCPQPQAAAPRLLTPHPRTGRVVACLLRSLLKYDSKHSVKRTRTCLRPRRSRSPNQSSRMLSMVSVSFRPLQRSPPLPRPRQRASSSMLAPGTILPSHQRLHLHRHLLRQRRPRTPSRWLT